MNARAWAAIITVTCAIGCRSTRARAPTREDARAHPTDAASASTPPDVRTEATPVYVEDTTEPDSPTRAREDAAQFKRDIVVGPRRIAWVRWPLSTEAECLRLRACYRDALARSPDVRGRLVFMVTSEKGKVTIVKTSWREGIPDALVSCVERVVRGLAISFDTQGLWLPFRFTTEDESDVYPHPEL